MRALFRIRDARVFLIGSGLSMLGDSAMFLVLGIWAKDLTHSNSAAGLVFFVLVLPSLFAPFAGLVIDRVRKKPLIIGVNCVMAAAVLLLLFVHDRSDLWLIYVVAGIYGAAGAILGSARSAFLTVMLPRELLGDANAVFSTMREGLRLLAPLLGAGLYAAFSGQIVAIADGLTFVGLAVALLTELLAGVKHVFVTLPLRQIILATAACLLVVGFSETLFFAVVEFGLHRPPSFLGVLESLQGLGAIIGGVTAGRALRRFGDVRLVGLGMALFAVGDASFASSSLPVVCAGIIVAGFAVSWFIVGFSTSIQLRTPQRLQGRVASAANTMVGTPQTIGIALGAVLISVLDYRVLVAVMFVAISACSAYLLTRGPEPIAAAEEPALA
jgi:MFS family permease